MEWILAVGGFAIGMVGGIFLGQSSGGTKKIRKQVEEELQAVQDELSNYRNEVTMHFSKTAGLFNAVTSDYQKLYQHLADGAQQFSQSDALLPDAVTKLAPLAPPVESGQQDETGAEPATEQEQKVEQAATEAAVTGVGDSSAESQPEEKTAATAKDEGVAGQAEGEQAAEAQATASEAAGETQTTASVAAGAAGETEIKNVDSEAAAEQLAAKVSETQAGLEEEISAASGKKAEEPAGSQPGSDKDTFTVPVSEKEAEKRIH